MSQEYSEVKAGAKVFCKWERANGEDCEASGTVMRIDRRRQKALVRLAGKASYNEWVPFKGITLSFARVEPKAEVNPVETPPVFKVGDWVECVMPMDGWLTLGEKYEVLDVWDDTRDCGGLLDLKSDGGRKAFLAFRFKKCEAPKAEVKPVFKVGDMVQHQSGNTRQVRVVAVSGEQVWLEENGKGWISEVHNWKKVEPKPAEKPATETKPARSYSKVSFVCGEIYPISRGQMASGSTVVGFVKTEEDAKWWVEGAHRGLPVYSSPVDDVGNRYMWALLMTFSE